MSFSTSDAPTPTLNDEQKAQIRAQTDFFGSSLTPQNQYNQYSDQITGGAGSTSPQNLYTQYSGAMFGGFQPSAYTPDFGLTAPVTAPGQSAPAMAPQQQFQAAQAAFNPTPGGVVDPGIGIQSSSMASPNTKLTDYAPIIGEMQQYIQSMQKIVDSMSQRF